jgi:hypothetical protein
MKRGHSSSSEIMQWSSTQLENSLDIKVAMSGKAVVKYFYSAWGIEEVKVDYQMALVDKNEMQWTYTPVDYSFPQSIPLPYPVIGKIFQIKLKKGPDQTIPFFEMRGCLLHGM